jgi:hypothetical protein
MSVTKIFPSPTLPVLEAPTMASITCSTGDLDPGLRNEVHDVLGSPVKLRMAALPAETLDLGDGHARHTNFRQRRTNIVQLEGFDNGSDQFH